MYTTNFTKEIQDYQNARDALEKGNDEDIQRTKNVKRNTQKRRFIWGV